MPGTSHTPGPALREVSHPDGCTGHFSAVRRASRRRPAAHKGRAARRSYAVNSAERRLVGEVDGRLFRARAAAVLPHVTGEHVGLLVVVSPFVGGDQAP